MSDEEEDFSTSRRNKYQTQKLKRVTLSKADLEAAIFSLFQQKSEYKLAELESKLNHPRATLKAATKTMCNYDYQRKVYTLKFK